MTKKIDFSRRSSIRIGPIVDVYQIEDLDYPKDAILIGSANNLLISPTPAPLMMLSKKFDYIKEKSGKLIIGAATPSGKIVSYCRKHNIANFEFLAHLPGTLGGIIKMNAGLKEYEIFNNITAVNIAGKLIEKKDIGHGYRYTDISDVIFEAHFKIEIGFQSNRIEEFKIMRSNQPKEPSAGSCFKNPPNDYAGRLIEEVGLKGKRIGNMSFSSVHANFLVNLGGGTFEEAIFLINEAKKKIYEKFNIQIEEEIIVIK